MSVREEAGQRVGDGRPLGGPRVQAERDQRRVPEEQSRDDPRDQREDEVRLAEVAAVEAPRSLHLADPERRRDAGEHEHDEDVDHERVPPLALEPAERRSGGKRGLAVDDPDDRHEDRREEDEEPPEDERVHEPRHEPLEQLALAEDDRRLVADTHGEVGRARDRLARAARAG